jgi:hypothetical protein
VESREKVFDAQDTLVQRFVEGIDLGLQVPFLNLEMLLRSSLFQEMFLP